MNKRTSEMALIIIAAVAMSAVTFGLGWNLRGMHSGSEPWNAWDLAWPTLAIALGLFTLVNRLRSLVR